MKRIFLLVALLSGQCFAQGVWFSSNVTTVSRNVPAGASAPVLTLPNAIVTVCASPAAGSPCTNTVPIYNDQAMTSGMSNPLTADSQGRFGFWVAAGNYSYSVQNPDGTVVGTYPLSLDSPVGPQGPGGIGCGTGNCVVTGSLTSQNITVINNVEDASLFAGADIGAKINAAFAACPATESCKVTLPPGNNYSFSTMITVPGTLEYTELDCQNSALTFTGIGDAVQVAQKNGADPTGAINNCRIINGPSNTASLAAVHQFSRIWFAYNNNTFYGFNNAGGVGVELENNAGSGWPGYNERTQFHGNSFSLDTKGVQFKINGGTNSFARTVMVGSAYNLQAGQFGISVEGTGSFQSADVYDSHLEARGNISGAGARAVSITNGGDVRLGMVNFNFEGPNTSYLVYVDNVATSFISAVGTTSANGLSVYNPGTSDQISVPQLNTDFTVQNGPFVNTDQQALNSKLIWGGNSLRYGIPDDTYNYGYFQLFKRTTINPSDPEVDAEPTTGNTQTNLLYCNLHGCGFGSGYGPTATRGGTNDPIHELTFNGTFGNQAGTSGTDTDGTIYAPNMNFNMHASGAIINTGGFGFGWQHNLSTTAGSDYLVLNVNTPASAFSIQAVIIDALGNVSIPSIKAATGTRYVCIDTSGKLISQATACSGT